MKRKPVVFLLACISLLLCSCEKFSNGDVIEKTRQLEESFQMIELHDNVNVTLKHCNASNPAGFIQLKTGENLWDGISTEVEADTFCLQVNGNNVKKPFNKLVIRNDNTLDFLRPYDYILEMTVYYDSIISIAFNSNGCIDTDTLRGYNFPTHFTKPIGHGGTLEFDSLVANLHIEATGGSGDLKVKTNCHRLTTVYEHGTSNIILSGKAKCTEVYGDYDCHGVIDGTALEAINYYGTFNGTNAVIAKAFERIQATNNNIGHFYYVPYEKEGKHIFWGHYNEAHHWIPNDTIDTIYQCPRNLVRLGDHIENILPYPY